MMTKGNKRKSSKIVVSRDYIDALTDYWGGRHRTTLEHVSNLLADRPDHASHLSLYRMWIELLADEGNFTGLRSLGEHLSSVAATSEANAATFLALQGIVHFELDEMEGAQFFASTVVNETTCPYSSELQFLCARRLGNTDIANQSVVRVASNVGDFLHMKNAMTYFYSEENYDAFNQTMETMSKVYPEAPAPMFFAMVDAFQGSEYEESHDYAVNLIDAYPSQSDYWFWAAFTLIKLDKTEEAMPFLNKYVELEGENDPDVLSLIGHCHTKEYQKTKDEKSRERAGYFLRKAEEILEAFGIDAVYVNRNFQNIRRHAPDQGTGKAWVYYLNAPKFAGIHFSDEKDAQFLECRIGNDVNPGDIVFIATKDPVAPKGEKRWKIGSVYLTASETVGTTGQATTLLELVGRPSVSLPLNVNTLGIDEGTQDPGVYELDDVAVETIIKSMEEFYGALPGEGRIFQELARIVSVS